MYNSKITTPPFYCHTHSTFYILSLQLTLQDFTHHNIELACTFMEHCGRYLLLSPESYLRTKALLVSKLVIIITINDITSLPTMIPLSPSSLLSLLSPLPPLFYPFSSSLLLSPILSPLLSSSFPLSIGNYDEKEINTTS